MTDNLVARIAPSLALRPWAQRPDEPLEDWLAFLAWLLTTPRAPVIPEGARAAAVQWDWLRRAAMAEHALAPREDPRIIAEQVARNTLGILHREIAARFAESERDPGRVPWPELLRLYALVLQIAPSLPQPDEGDTRIDLSAFTPAEAAQFAYLCAKAYRPK